MDSQRSLRIIQKDANPAVSVERKARDKDLTTTRLKLLDHGFESDYSPFFHRNRRHISSRITERDIVLVGKKVC